MRRSGALVCFCLAAIALGAIVPAAAEARTEIFKLHSRSFRLAGFQTIFPKILVPAPRRSGYITRMEAHLVDRRGRRVSIREVMLHHIVFITNGRDKKSSCKGSEGEPFWGTGEERQPLRLPNGYGYRVARNDSWRMQTMLMSHGLKAHDVRVAYTLRMVVGRRLTRVKPLWLRANGCSQHPSYDVEGDLPPGSTHTKSSLWRMPLSGRIVAASGHLHGSSYGLKLTQPRCENRLLIDEKPLYGLRNDLVYRVRPVLHEPGPIATGMFLSQTGIPVRKGEMLKLTGLYDGSRPHPRVMAIAHVYIAIDGDASRACNPIPRDAHIFWTRKDGRFDPPVVDVPLNGLRHGKVVAIDRPPGPERVVTSSATLVRVGDERFTPANLSVARGTKVVWRFTDVALHNILLAGGPRRISSTTLGKGGRYEKTLYAPGKYKLFCYLHPITMTQVIDVRP